MIIVVFLYLRTCNQTLHVPRVVAEVPPYNDNGAIDKYMHRCYTDWMIAMIIRTGFGIT